MATQPHEARETVINPEATEEPIPTPLDSGTSMAIPFAAIDPHSPNVRWANLKEPMWDQYPQPADDSDAAQAQHDGLDAWLPNARSLPRETDPASIGSTP